MKYKLPYYIVNTNINNPLINYCWDDSNVESCLDYSYAEKVIDKVNLVSWCGKITLITGVYEWVLGRFENLFQCPLYFDMAEAAYCGCINIYYLIPHYELDNMSINRYDYLGPVKGVLWCAGRSSVMPGFYVADHSGKFDDDYDEDYGHYTLNKWQGDLEFLIALTLHILPQDKVSIFKVWLEGVIERLREFHSMPEVDPEENLFSHLFGYKNEIDRLGDYVAREILDLNYDYNPAEAVKLCDNYLQSVDYKNNPFLLPPEQLIGKIKTPYRLIEE